ncbi:MAG: hypothetical protein K0R39_2582 [Symbiobacteriaceae bacterium]|jgi:hypothetical protein|nr:hypothetical protein [Symbiobacteriaceae bacterium]
MNAWEYLVKLSRHPHRGTATDGEAAAAASLRTWLQQLGYRVDTQEFRTPRDTLYLGPSAVLLGFAAAALAGLIWPLWALAGCLVLLVPMIGEMLGSPRIDFDLLLPTYPSQNLVVRRPAASALPGRRLVITAHYDTQRATLLFHPKVAPHLQAYFTAVYALIAAVPVLLGLRWQLPDARAAGPVLVGLTALLLLNVAFLLYCKVTGRYINGANDNGTGAALLLSLADHFAAAPLSDTELWFVLTGAEEVGTRGMKHFMRGAALDRASTMFINLDNLGGGKLHYLLGEGMLAFRPYGADMTALAEKLALAYPGRVKAKKNLLLPTDAAVPAQAGYQAISFLAFGDDGSLPNYHWHTDTIDKIDRDLLRFAEGFIFEYVHRLSGETAAIRATK